MLAISTPELDAAPPLQATVKCKRCGGTHTVQAGDVILPGGKIVKGASSLSFYTCGDHDYLCGIDGKQIGG